MPSLRMGLVLPLLLAAAPLPLGGCQMNERLSGTAMGATGGAVLGGVIGESVGGALVGGVAGGLAGYLIGDYLADQRERQCCAPASYGPGACAPCASGSATDGGSPARAASRAAYARGQRAATAVEARAAYREAVAADPAFPEAWNALGLNALYAGDHAEADRCFRQALAADPTFFPARQNLALIGPS